MTVAVGLCAGVAAEAILVRAGWREWCLLRDHWRRLHGSPDATS